MSTPDDGSLSRAWDALLRGLAASAARVDGLGGGGAAEGHRHVLRLLDAGLDLFVERADPLRPEPTVWMNPTRKFLGDNPDTIYTTAPVEGASSYVLEVTPGNAVYTGIVVYGRSDAGWRVISSGTDTDLNGGGRDPFTVSLSASDPGTGAGNWLPLAPDALWVMVREYFADREAKDPATVHIIRDGGTGGDAIDEGALARRLESLASWVEAQVAADEFLSSMQLAQPNRPPDLSGVAFPPELVATFLPTPDIDYQGCAFALDEGQALVVRGVAPDARYWSLQVMNRWLESIDGRSGWNGAELGVPAGAPFEIVLADVPPPGTAGVPLHGRRQGLLAFRTLLPNGEVPRVTFEVVDGG
jgi:hypothetical protein